MVLLFKWLLPLPHGGPPPHPVDPPIVFTIVIAKIVRVATLQRITGAVTPPERHKWSVVVTFWGIRE